MKALSLWRPWPWAIMHAPADVAKRIENRNWMPPISAIGTRIALHASKRFDGDAVSFFLTLGLDAPARYDQYPSSAVVGVATIDRVVTETKTLSDAQARWFFTERSDGKQNYGWVLADVRALARPVPCRGMQGLFALPDDVERAVLDQLKEIPCST